MISNQSFSSLLYFPWLLKFSQIHLAKYTIIPTLCYFRIKRSFIAHEFL